MVQQADMTCDEIRDALDKLRAMDRPLFREDAIQTTTDVVAMNPGESRADTPPDVAAEIHSLEQALFDKGCEEEQ